MNRRLKIYIGLLVLLFIGAIIIEFSTPQPVNWEPTYNERHTIPFGTYIIHEELPNLFPSSDLKDIKVSPYEYFDEFYSWQDSSYSVSGTYMYIDRRFHVDDISSQEILDFAGHGNTIFISSHSIPERFKDSLFLETKHDYDFNGKASLSFASSQFTKDSISVERGLNNIYFSEIDSTNTTVLGYQKFGDKEYINFIKIDYKFGNIFLHLQPVAFTNYMLLKNNNQKYAAAALSYLPDEDIFYDSPNKIHLQSGNTPLRFILSQPALKWAWIMGLLSLLVFIIFNAKRKQRIIKVIKPLQNTTIAFIKTIGNLYYETKDHNTIINKKITYFFEHIRRHYLIDTETLDEQFIKTLSQKSGKKLGDLKKLINLIVHLRAKTQCTESDLLELNTLMEDFYTK